MGTLKGACIIGQSGGPTSVINASAYGAIKTALENENITKVYGALNGIRGVLDDNLIDMGKEDPEELAYMKYTPSSALGSCRYKLKSADVDDTDYIVLDEFCMTSRKVRIKFHLKADFEYPEGTEIEIQRQVGNKRFETIDVIPAVQNGVYEWMGFEVGQRTSWRLHIAITTD